MRQQRPDCEVQRAVGALYPAVVSASKVEVVAGEAHVTGTYMLDISVEPEALRRLHLLVTW